jgi:hypothetical protein
MSPTERAIYNAYLANPNVNKYSELVRQLCDDPRIADEIKGQLSSCKTPEDIEKTLVKHYQKDVETMQNKIDLTLYRIKKIQRRITVIEYKRQRKYLKQKGFKVKIQFPAKIYDPKFENKKELNRAKLKCLMMSHPTRKEESNSIKQSKKVLRKSINRNSKNII